MKKKLAALIEGAKILGLHQRDLDDANDFLINHEYGLCYDTVITQLYEYDIKIDNKIYSLISKIAKDLSFSENDYLFMKDLVRAETEISKKL